MAHAHAHAGRGDPEVALQIPRRLRRTLTFAVLPFAVITLVGLVALWPTGKSLDLSAVFGGSASLVKATVTATRVEPCEVVSGAELGIDGGSGATAAGSCVTYTARLTSGRDRGRAVHLEAGGDASDPTVHKGDRILVGRAPGGEGDGQFYFADFQRGKPIAVLLLLFVGAAVAFGRWSGARALAALAASILAIVWFIIPSVLDHNSPVAVALVGAATIMLLVLYLTGGFTTQSTVAVLGTMASLALIALLAIVFVAASHFTGLANEDAVFLQAATVSIDLQGLLLGGIIIGSLGVLDDMTVTQVSAVWELRRANDDYDMRSLYRAAERIGRDHIASTVNTLVLAYAGASLPLMIYFTSSHQSIAGIATSEVIAVEIVRTVVGSIGLIASVPITTAIAAYVVTRPDVASRAT